MVGLRVILGKLQSWGAWKLDDYFKEWRFDFSIDDKHNKERKMNWNRMKKAWDRAGRKVCEAYDIKFQDFGSKTEDHGTPLN